MFQKTYIIIAIILIVILVNKNKSEPIVNTLSLSLNRDRQVGKRGNVPYYIQTDLSGFVTSPVSEDLNFQVIQNQRVIIDPVFHAADGSMRGSNSIIDPLFHAADSSIIDPVF